MGWVRVRVRVLDLEVGLWLRFCLGQRQNISSVVALQKISGLSLRARGQGFPPVTMSMVPGYLHRKVEGK